LLYSLAIPKLTEHLAAIRLELCYNPPGAHLPVGAKLADISMDLSSHFAQNCPPISFHRIVLREKLFLRAWLAQPGAFCAQGAGIAIFSDAEDEPADTAITRPVRIMTAGITYHPGMWTGQAV
jgi:hypothetical protein